MEERIHILTTQNVGINYEIAGLGDRYIAGLIDLFVLIAYLIAFVFIAEELDVFEAWMFYLFLLLPILLYDVVLEILLNGQSLGKYLMQLKVVNVDGSQVSIGGYLLRWLLRPIDVWMSMGGVAIISIILTGTGQRLGDLAAGTTVINLKSRSKLKDTLFTPVPDGHETSFPEVNRLTDKDVALIKEIINEANRLQNNKAITLLAAKVANTLQVQTDMPPRTFLDALITDYNHLHSR